MKFRNQVILVLLMIFGFALSAHGFVCPVCGAADISGLALTCPECNANLHDPVLKIKTQKKAALRIRLLYTGDNLERLPPYGKLYVNGIYKGNIDLTDKEERNQDFVSNWNSGLGRDYTAVYERVMENIPAGLLKIEVEMKFDRLYGLGRSFKRVVFPYVGFKSEKETTVEHYFNSAATFHLYKPGKKHPLPVLSETKVQGASGTVAINIGLFK
jgi:hypothetical protein